MKKSCLLSILLFILVPTFEKPENSKSPAVNRQGNTELHTEKMLGISEKDSKMVLNSKQQQRAKSTQRPQLITMHVALHTLDPFSKRMTSPWELSCIVDLGDEAARKPIRPEVACSSLPSLRSRCWQAKARGPDRPVSGHSCASLFMDYHGCFHATELCSWDKYRMAHKA